MARIRSIKPEFPQSESMGRVSRDARLTFVQLWTISDDEGRLRGNSRMLASLLFPYDDDAPSLIDGWLRELEREECIVRYKIGTQSYIQLCNWLIHQKIDKPTKSKMPAFDESSREVANPLEDSSEEGKGRERKGREEEGIKPFVEPDDPTASIFAYWKQIMGKPRAQLDSKRSRSIKARLKDGYSPEQLCKAIDGCSNDPFSMGKNDRNTPFNDIELICRDSAHVDKFIEISGRPNTGLDARLQRQVDALNEWMALDDN